MPERQLSMFAEEPEAAVGRPEGQPLFEGPDWDFETLDRTYDAIEEIALEDLGLDVYPNQVEVISSEQMLDAYSSIGIGPSASTSCARRPCIARAIGGSPTRS
jgi:hypothetical protein